jgi:UDP-glucose 4-epimerase
VLERIEQITGKCPAFYRLNVWDEQTLSGLFTKEKGIQVFIHFAASRAVGESDQKKTLDYYKNNLLSLVNLLERMQSFSVRYLIFSSSFTVYGQPNQLPIIGLSPFKPAESPYGNSKQICEEILRGCCKADPDLRAVGLRYFDPEGALPSARIGELPLGWPNNLIPFLFQSAAGIQEQLRVFGYDYNTPSGTAIRNYIHVVDLAKAHHRA